jgi:hypothetical protein
MPPELCERCQKRPATETWGDAFVVAHGGGLRWCLPCCLETQIAHAEERAEALPEMRRRLAELTTTEEDGAS